MARVRDIVSSRVRTPRTTEVTTVDESASLEEAMEAMHRHNCRHLPVTRSGEVAGFLFMRDLMDFHFARQTEELHHMQAYIHGAA